MKPLELTEQTFDSTIANADKPVLVDFWATWCGPCRAMAPVLEQIAGDEESRLTVCKVNVDENPTITQRFGIAAIPTVILFKNGEKATEITGAMPKESLMSALEKYL